MTLLTQTRQRFGENNTPLLLLLGLLSRREQLISTLDRILELEAPQGAPTQIDHKTSELILGVISILDTVQRVASQHAATAGSDDCHPTDSRREDVADRGWLR